MNTSQLQENEYNQPNPQRWKALSLLALAQFVIILDTSIIGVALPTIQDHFGFLQSDLQWIFNAYVIVFGALLLLGGRLSDVLGQKKIFIIGFTILTVASIIAGLATSGSILIAARALQGLGAAFIAPSALAIVMSLFGNNKVEMNKAMGIWEAAGFHLAFIGAAVISMAATVAILVAIRNKDERKNLEIRTQS